MKLHEQREVEEELRSAEAEEPPPKRRRGGEVGRDWVCTQEGCQKDFKSVRRYITCVAEIKAYDYLRT